MCPLSDTWRMDAANAYLDGLRVRGLNLEVLEGRLRIPPGHTPSEVELARLLKPELMALLEADTHFAGKEG